MDAETIELGNLCPDLIESIFSRINIKSITKLKIVSKTWCNVITDLRRSNPPTTTSGLVIFLRQINNNPTLHESIFIKVQDQSQGQDCTLHASFKHSFSTLIDSCNGLLLYAGKNGHFWTYHVSSPVLDQHISLPPAHKTSRPACASLAFDGIHQDWFRVICFFWAEVDIMSGTMNCQIFSSQTWEWTEHQARILYSGLLLEDGFVHGQCFGSGVFSRGRLYWIWSLCLLVYDDKREFFKLIRLPKNKSTRTRSNVYLSQLLWESEGCIHLCDPVDEGFYIWAFNDDHDDFEHESMDYDLRWRFERVVMVVELKSGWSWTSIRPCAFNEDLQVLYLELSPGTIVSYSFETKKIAQVWFYGEPGEDYFMSNIYPFLFKSVNLLACRK
ncbi:unnamed protein product [Ilex paraguariensis]|uniref:F-box domain-containing protein n=1 Tax=Ilex paraguariensis TaxID=185542 RepID=A0ABC8T8V2_9AQUA